MQGDWETCTQEAVGIQLPTDFPHSALSAQQLYSGAPVPPLVPDVQLCSHRDALEALSCSDNF